MKTLNLDNNLIDNKYYFLYNGHKLKKNDYEKTILEFGIINNSYIIAIEDANMIEG